MCPNLKRQENIYSVVRAEKMKNWEKIAKKLAFRKFLHDKAPDKTEDDLELQEIYNRFFFFRKDEVK